MRLFRNLGLAALVLTTWPAFSAVAKPRAVRAEQAVRALEEGYLQARVSGNTAPIRAALAGKGAIIRDNGDEQTTATHLVEIATQPHWTAVETMERHVDLYHEAAVTHAIIRVSQSGQTAPGKARTTGVYIHRKGVGRMVSWQSTPLP